MTEQVRTVRLYGALGARFGRAFRLAVGSPAEAVRALCMQLEGFEQFLRGERYHYLVFCGRRNVPEDQLHFTGGQEDIRIAPVVAGSGSGAGQLLLGAVLIAASFIVPGAGAAAMMFWGGIGMAVGGVVQMMVPQPRGLKDSSGPENKPSYAFGGPVNTVAQGNPVALGYGRRRVGGAIISAGIYAEDME